MELKWKLGDWAYFSRDGIIHKKVITDAAFVLNRKNELCGTYILKPFFDSSYSHFTIDDVELYKTAEEIREVEYAKIDKMLEKLG